MSKVLSAETRRRISERNRGKRRSAETRARISAAMRGIRHPNFGKHLSVELRQKLSEAHRGKRFSVQTRQRQSAASKRNWQNPEVRQKRSEGIKRSWQDPERRAKGRDALRGERNPWFGKHHTAETRAQMSETRRGKRCKPFSAEHCARLSEALRGKHPTTETRHKLSELGRHRWQDPIWRERQIAAWLKAQRVRPTAPECRTQEVLDRHFPGEWKYTGDFNMWIGGKNPDFIALNGRKAVLEVFGDWWHNEEHTGIPRERAVSDRIAHFANYGFRCLVLWASELANEDSVISRVRRLID